MVSVVVNVVILVSVVVSDVIVVNVVIVVHLTSKLTFIRLCYL